MSLSVFFLFLFTFIADGAILKTVILKGVSFVKRISFQRDIEIYGEYDVVVIGGGPAGVCSAIAAARQGERVLLVEATSSLGGMAVGGLVGPFMTDFDRDGNTQTVAGIFSEVVERLKKYSAAIPSERIEAKTIYTSFIKRYHRHVTPFDSFYLQIVLDEMVREAGVELLCYTQFSDVVVENGAIQCAVFCAAEGLIAVLAKVFIDCTGTAAVAEKAGVPTYKGDEESGTPQPGTLMFEIGNVDDDRYTERPEKPVKAYKMPQKGRYKVNHYHVYNVDAANSKSLTDAHSEARHQVLDAFSVLHEKTVGFENSEITSVAPVLGIRESRHIEGEYKITVQDVSDGVKYPDRIAVYGFGMDVHNRNVGETGNFKIEVAPRYYIPYRSLLPKKCLNLLVAGKTISCESQAVGGMRCMPAAMAMGQAAGIAAALSLNFSVSLREVDITLLQNELIKNGAIID